MAAIKPFYADNQDLNPGASYNNPEQELENTAMTLTEPDLFEGTGGSVALGAIPTDRILGALPDNQRAQAAMELENAALSSSHASLVRQSWVRRAVWEEIKNAEMDLVQRGNEFWLEFRDINVEGPAYSLYFPNSPPRNRLLTWTTKMSAPSFSLPAGVPSAGGSCQGAEGGQTIDTPSKFAQGSENLSQVTGKPSVVQDAICQHCYATKGNYEYASMNIKQLMIFAWTIQAVRAWAHKDGPQPGNFVDVMTAAIHNWDFQLGPYMENGKSYLPEREDLPYPYYFRIHDSGDFYHKTYLAAWKAVADNLPDVCFWAPTRIWNTGWGINEVRRINGDGKQRNFIVRPSIYHVNEAPPANTKLAKKILDPRSGFAGWTTVYSKARKPLPRQTDYGPGELVEMPQVVADVTGRSKVQLHVLNDESAAALNRPYQPDIRPAPYGFDCQAYLSEKGEAESCRNASPPARLGGAQGIKGCRACWVADRTTVNYTQH